MILLKYGLNWENMKIEDPMPGGYIPDIALQGKNASREPDPRGHQSLERSPPVAFPGNHGLLTRDGTMLFPVGILPEVLMMVANDWLPNFPRNLRDRHYLSLYFSPVCDPDLLIPGPVIQQWGSTGHYPNGEVNDGEMMRVGKVLRKINFGGFYIDPVSFPSMGTFELDLKSVRVY